MKQSVFFLSIFFTTVLSTPEDFLQNITDTYHKAKQRSKRFIFIPDSTTQNLVNPYERPTPPEAEVFDFIVVGSGAAGSALANRLSENPKWKVLLLEVGDEATPLTDIPVIAPLFQFTDLNWNYLMEKQDGVCLGLVDQRMAWPRGRGIGGTSLINYMIHTRGNRRDYDRWAKLGNPGWSYRDVFRYFTKAEDSTVNGQDPGYHGIGNYLSVEDVRYRTESAKAFVEAAKQLGYIYVDYNGKSQMGVSFVQSTTKRGRRWSAEAAYLRNFTNRPNLVILPRSRAIKILINNSTKEAYGVQYIRDRQYRTVLASKEVILSAGAFNSPQLLMLSGIGPAEHLQELDIPVLQDLPVGKKLYDHITFLGLVFTVNQSIVGVQEQLYQIPTFLQYITNGTGPLTLLGGVEALLYLQTKASQDPKEYPDIEMIFVSGSMSTDRGEFYRKTFRVTDEIYNAVFKDLEDKYTFSILPLLAHPKSHGFLKLKSKNPYHWPKFYGRYFTDPENHDIKTFIAAIREAQRIVQAPALQKYGAQIVTTKIPGCTKFTWDSDEYWECALRHTTPTLHHQVATCKMGPSDDPEAVVDAKLRVYGVKNLRVADTSVIPIPLTAHTNVPAFMIGEKAADLLKEDWNDPILLRGVDVRFDNTLGGGSTNAVPR